MTKLFPLSHRLMIGACCALLLCAAIPALSSGAHAQTPPAGQAQPKKKKLPPGAKGFEQYAGRDASDKLVTGGATRGGPEVGVAENVAKALDALARGNEAYEDAQGKEEAGQKQEAVAQYTVAAQAYKEAATALPNMFRASYMLGGAYEALGQLKEAADAYQHAVTLKPDTDSEMPHDSPGDIRTAYYNLGNVRASLGQHKEAIAAYQQVSAHSQTPKYTKCMPLYNIGLSYVALGQQQDAIKAFQEAIESFKARLTKLPDEKNPKFEMTYYNLGVAYSKLEQYPEAAEAFKQALALAPDHAEAHYNLGVVYYMLDNRQGLVEQQKALLGSKPELAKELAKLLTQ